MSRSEVCRCLLCLLCVCVFVYVWSVVQVCCLVAFWRVQHYNNRNSSVYCKSCKIHFASAERLEQHVDDEHVKCPFPDCAFSANFRNIEKHIDSQHMLFNNGSVQINDETWLEERKKRFPSAQRAALRREEQLEKIRRGEKLGMSQKPFEDNIKSISGKGKHNQFPGRNEKRQFKDNGPEVFKKQKVMENNSKQDEQRNFQNADTHRPKKHRKFNRRNRKRQIIQEQLEILSKEAPTAEEIDPFDSDNEQRDGIPAFKGTRKLYEETGEMSYFVNTVAPISGADDDEHEADMISDDEEWGQDVSVGESVAGATLLGGALGSLMTMYTDSEEEADAEPTAAPSDNTCSSVSIVSKQDSVALPNEGKAGNPKQEENISSDKFQGNEENIHSEQNHNNTSHRRKRNNNKKKNPKDKPKLPPKPVKPRRRKKTLLEKLLRADIIHERNVILQCVRFVVENNFFIDSSSKSTESKIMKETKGEENEDASSSENSTKSQNEANDTGHSQMNEEKGLHQKDADNILQESSISNNEHNKTNDKTETDAINVSQNDEKDKNISNVKNQECMSVERENAEVDKQQESPISIRETKCPESKRENEKHKDSNKEAAKRIKMELLKSTGKEGCEGEKTESVSSDVMDTA